MRLGTLPRFVESRENREKYLSRKEKQDLSSFFVRGRHLYNVGIEKARNLQGMINPRYGFFKVVLLGGGENAGVDFHGQGGGGHVGGRIYLEK